MIHGWFALLMLLALTSVLPADSKATDRDEHRPSDVVGAYERGESEETPS